MLTGQHVFFSRYRTTLLWVLAMAFILCNAPQAQAFSWNPLKWFGSSSSEPAQEETPVSEDTASEEAPVQNDIHANEGVLLQTAKGDIYIKLYWNEAPITVKNFVGLVEDNFYNAPKMKFHRVVPGFVVQTGDPTGTGYGGSKKTIPLEAKSNKLSHDTKGVVAMARGPAPNSASSQFYITLTKQTQLDGKYAIFGQVIRGIPVLEKIEKNDRLYGAEIVNISEVQPDPPPPVEKKKKRFWLF